MLCYAMCIVLWVVPWAKVLHLLVFSIPHRVVNLVLPMDRTHTEFIVCV